MKLYKSKNFVNENCNNVEFIYFYNHNKDKFEFSFEAKNMIKNEIDKNLKDFDIDINFQIILGSKQIHTIDYYELYLDNKKIMEELNNTKNRLNKLEEEINNIKKYLLNIKNEDTAFQKQENENEGKNIRILSFCAPC